MDLEDKSNREKVLLRNPIISLMNQLFLFSSSLLVSSRILSVLPSEVRVNTPTSNSFVLSKSIKSSSSLANFNGHQSQPNFSASSIETN